MSQSLTTTTPQTEDRSLFTIGVLFFDGVEELDAVGPWEVFRFWKTLSTTLDVSVISLSPDGQTVRCGGGLRIEVDEVLPIGDDDPNSQSPRGQTRLDLLLYPGGQGATALASDDAHLAGVRALAAAGTVMASVCTGAIVLARAGLLHDMRATTHWHALDQLVDADPSITVDPDARYVDQGPTLTSAGVSAGIDMALHIVERFEYRDVATAVARAMQYDRFV